MWLHKTTWIFNKPDRLISQKGTRNACAEAYPIAVNLQELVVRQGEVDSLQIWGWLKLVDKIAVYPLVN